jgi:hypothetical protein
MSRVLGICLIVVVAVLLQQDAPYARAHFPPFASNPGVRLGIDRERARAGGEVRVRIENSASSDVAWGYAYELAHWQAGEWSPLPPHPVFAPRLVVPAGTVGRWQRVRIPRGAVPGLYRIRKWVKPFGSRRRTVKATFRVTVKRESNPSRSRGSLYVKRALGGCCNRVRVYRGVVPNGIAG